MISTNAELIIFKSHNRLKIQTKLQSIDIFSVNNCTLPTVPNTDQIPFSTIEYNADVTYTCQDGYSHTAGTLTRSCKADGTLTGLTPLCTSKLHLQ